MLGRWTMTAALAVVREASIIAVACTAVGVAVNLVHPRGIPLVAEQEYEILVPCPEPGGEVLEVAADDPALLDRTSFFVDARDPRLVMSWRFRDATNVPFDYLDPTPDQVVRDLAGAIARSRARRVVVYGDGDRPDTGEQLAREISGQGIHNVLYVAGGAPALMSVERSRGGGP